MTNLANIPPEQSELIERLALAIGSHQGVTIPLDLGVFEAYVVVAQLQLSLSHPDNRGEGSECARKIAKMLQDYLGHEIDPVLSESLEYGWHRDVTEDHEP